MSVSRVGRSTLNLPAVEIPGNRDVFLRAVKERTEGTFDILGEMGHYPDGGIVYLGRDVADGSLRLLRLTPGEIDKRFHLDPLPHLSSDVPTQDSHCPRPECGAKLDYLSPFCPHCGADLRGEGPTEEIPAEALLKAVEEKAADEYEILGEMRHARGGGNVYFGRGSNGMIVALRLLRKETGTYELRRTVFLKSLVTTPDAQGVKPATPVRPSGQESTQTERDEPHPRPSFGPAPVSALHHPAAQFGLVLLMIVVAWMALYTLVF